MAAILSTAKTLVIEDNAGNRWKLTMNGDFDVRVSTSATFEDGEIKDLCSIRVTNGESTVARFLVYENAYRKMGYFISGIPRIQADGSRRKIVLAPAEASEDISMEEIYYRSGLESIKVR